jgi:hypothetical protein
MLVEAISPANMKQRAVKGEPHRLLEENDSKLSYIFSAFKILLLFFQLLPFRLCKGRGNSTFFCQTSPPIDSLETLKTFKACYDPA